MGFFTGRATFLRYRVDGPSPGIFGPTHLEKLSAHAIGRQRTADKDGVEAGWIGKKVKRGFYDYSGERPVPTR